MPTLARPDVDVLEGLTTAILVDQERMGLEPTLHRRHRHRRQRDAAHPLQPAARRLAQRVLFNVPSVRASGAITIERGAGRTRTEKATFTRLGGMCPRCEGMGSVTDLDVTALYDDSLSLATRARSRSPAIADGWYGRIFRGCGFFDPDKPIRKYTKKELHDLLHKEPTKIKADGINLMHEADPTDPEVDALQGQGGDAAAHPHVRGAGGDVHDLSRVRRHSTQQGGPVVEAQGSEHRRRLLDADQRPGRLGPGPRRAVGGSAGSPGCNTSSTRSRRSGWATSHSDRPSGTLSGGEAQRTKMIRHLGSSLTDVTYVFDEPTIGLHPHDIERMNDLLLQPRTRATPCSSWSTSRRRSRSPTTSSTSAPAPVQRAAPSASRAPSRGCGRVTPHRPPSRGPGRPRDGADAHRRWRSAARRRTTCATSTSTSRSRCSSSSPASPAPARARSCTGRSARRRGLDRPERDPRLATEQPSDAHRTARPDPQGVREGQRREAGALQRQLRGRLP